MNEGDPAGHRRATFRCGQSAHKSTYAPLSQPDIGGMVVVLVGSWLGMGGNLFFVTVERCNVEFAACWSYWFSLGCWAVGCCSSASVIREVRSGFPSVDRLWDVDVDTAIQIHRHVCE
jgi:hypothetical protein